LIIDNKETIIRIMAAALCAAVLLSWSLWDANSRDFFPTIPLWGEIARPNHFWPRINAVILVLLCLGIIWKPNHPILLIALTLWLTRLCITDLNRLQPWVWLYGLILILRLSTDSKQFFVYLRWLLATVYVWSGFNKMTPYFAEDNFAWLCETFECTRNWGQFPLLGYGLALFEMGLGIALLSPSLHSIVKWLIVVFHLCIIVILSAQNWNYVVIPWNIAMVGLVWLSGKPSFYLRHNFLDFSIFDFVATGCLVLSGICPAFSLIGWWPTPLSWNMYSNTQAELTLSTNQTSFCPTKEWCDVWTQFAYEKGTKLQADDWALYDLKVPLYSHPSTLRRLGTYYCKASGNSFFLLTVNRWDKSKEEMDEIKCNNQ